MEEAKGAFEAGRTPKEVLGGLRRWNGAVTAQDVYNLKAKISRRDKAIEGGTPVRGARLRGSKGGDGVVGAGVNGSAEGNGNINGVGQGGVGEGGVVDPALRGNIEHLTAAVAQMKEAEEAGPSDQAPAGRKCACTCCEH